MHNKTAKVLSCLIIGLALVMQQAHAQTCEPMICATVAQCSSPIEDTAAFKTVDVKTVAKITIVSELIMYAINKMDIFVSKAIATLSMSQTNAIVSNTDQLKKAMEVVAKKRQDFLISQRDLEAMQIASPSENLNQETVLKSHWPMSEALTRGLRLQLYDDHVRRVELEHEKYYSDKTNLRPQTYAHGTIAGFAKLYGTHRDFFCDPNAAQRPAGCGDEAQNEQWIKMGDQMLEIYLGSETWPETQVQKAVELMQYYLGMSPPDLPNTSNLSTGEGQRDYINYQGKLAKNNFLTYIMSYLVSKRAPTNNGQAAFVEIRKEAAGCDNETDANRDLCSYLNHVIARSGGRASKAELSKALEFDRFMNPAYINKSLDGTLGIDKDITLMMVDRLQQDYEAYQMEKMTTASMAGYYAELVNKSP